MAYGKVRQAEIYYEDIGDRMTTISYILKWKTLYQAT